MPAVAGVGMMLVGGMVVAMGMLARSAGRSAVPAPGFLVRQAVALGALALAVIALRWAGEGLLALAVRMGAGMAAYLAAAYALDLAGIRALARKRS